MLYTHTIGQTAWENQVNLSQNLTVAGWYAVWYCRNALLLFTAREKDLGK
jgi:hypothetical protein